MLREADLPDQPLGDASGTRLKKSIDSIMARIEPRIWKAAERLPATGFLVAWRERTFAKRESAVMLDYYRAVRTVEPKLKGQQLYEKVVATRLGCDVSIAHEIVLGAEESYAHWPNDRALNFRDVINYLIINHLITSHLGVVGTRAHVEAAVSEVVAAEL